MDITINSTRITMSNLIKGKTMDKIIRWQLFPSQIRNKIKIIKDKNDENIY